jgi:hypothetical protein
VNSTLDVEVDGSRIGLSSEVDNLVDVEVEGSVHVDVDVDDHVNVIT